MRTKITTFFTVLILLALTGCNNALPKEDKPQPFSFSESHIQSSPESEAPAAEEKQEVETTPEQPQDFKPEKKIPPTEESTATAGQIQAIPDTGPTAHPAELPKKADTTVTPDPKPKPSVSEQAESKEIETEIEFPPVYPVPECTEIEAKVAAYINQYRSNKATVLSGLTSVARYRSEQLITNFAHTDGIDACNALQYGEFVDMTLYGMSENDSYYQGYNREAIAKGNWTGTADEIAQEIANGFKNSSSHWNYLGSNEYSYIAVGCTYDEASSIWYCCICVSRENYGG